MTKQKTNQLIKRKNITKIIQQQSEAIPRQINELDVVATIKDG